MLSYFRIQLSPVHLQQIHLFLTCASPSSAPTLLPLINFPSYPRSPQYYIPNLKSRYSYLLRQLSGSSSTFSPTFILPFFIPIVHSSLVSYYSPSGSYERSVQPFQHSLSLVNVPIRTAHYYTLISKDSSLWQNLIPKFCLYTMSDKDYQSGLAWRFYLPHPQIPSGLTCTTHLSLLHSPIIDQEGHHLTTGMSAKPQRLLYILNYASCRPTLEDSCILRAHDEKDPDITVLNAPN